MKLRSAVVLAIVFVLAFAVPGIFAEDGKFALSAKAGTLGLGLEGAANLSSNFNARLGFNTFSYDYDGTESDIHYDFELDLQSVAGLVDWFPFEQGLRFTGGVLLNMNELDLTATPSGSYDIGGVTYTSAQVGSLTGKLDFDDVAPYVGVGWGNPFGRKGNLSFNFDLGFMFQGSPKVSVSTNGTLSSNAAFLADLEREKNDLEGDLDDFDIYPVIAFGITYKF